MLRSSNGILSGPRVKGFQNATCQIRVKGAQTTFFRSALTWLKRHFVRSALRGFKRRFVRSVLKCLKWHLVRSTLRELKHMYSYILDNRKNGKTAKGIKKAVIEKDVQHHDYIQVCSVIGKVDKS